MDEIRIMIPLNPVTKKNSQRIIKCGRYYRIMPSKQYVQYEKDAGHFLRRHGSGQPIAEPVEVTAVFYMKTRRRVDLTNLLEAVDDVLVKYGILEDDNSKVIISHDGSRVVYDKDNPRTEIIIRRMT